MCGGGGGPEPVVYTANDGTKSLDPNAVQRRNQHLELAAAIGLNTSGIDPDPTPGAPRVLEKALERSGRGGDMWNLFHEYADQGLTAADYRSEQRLKEQAAQAEQAEQQKVDLSAANRGAVNEAFSRYGDDYYNSITQNVLDYYTPQLDSQFEKANEGLTYRLADQGLLRSTTAGDVRADLKEAYGIQKGDISNRAASEATSAREQVENARRQALAYAENASDPGAVNERIAQETSRIGSYQPQLTPLAQLFTDFVSPTVQTGALAYGAKQRASAPPIVFNSGNKSSAQVVR